MKDEEFGRMVATVTLKKYIARCDEILSAADRSAAEALEREIVAVFKSDFTGLTQGLDMYGVAALNGIKQADHIKDIGILKARLQKELDAIEPESCESSEPLVRQKMIFISHSSKDKEYTKAFVDLLFAIGLNEDDIVCSSYPGVGIPLREKVYYWLVEKFQEYDLHVIYFLSHNYYQSAASLNEMGAAWAMKQKWDGILLPGFPFTDISGCIDSTQIAIKLDGDRDELKHRLGELKDDIVNEFGLRSVSETRWEKVRDSFIETVTAIIPKESELKKDYVPVKLSVDDDTISLHACVMLMYAAEDDGQIMVAQTLSGTSYQAGRTSLERNQTPRELALWDDAVARLLKKNYIKKVGRKDPIYQLTAIGFDIAEGFKMDNKLDPSKSPQEILKEFEE